MNKADSAFQSRNASDRQTTGEPPSFSTLYDQYAATILGILTKLVKDEVQATSLLELVFKTFMGQLDQLQKKGQPLFIALLQLARKTAIDSLNENSSPKIAALRLANDGKISVAEVQLDGLTASFDTQNKPVEVQQKELLDSVLLKSCTLDEAASSTGIPLPLARQQLRLAFQQVRTLRL